MLYKFSHALPVEKTDQIQKIAWKLSYSQKGLWLYKAITYILAILFYGFLFYKLNVFVAFAIVFLSHGYIDNFFAKFLAPHFDKRFSKVTLPEHCSLDWKINIDDVGLAYSNGYRTSHVMWSAVAKIIDHPESVIFYAEGGNLYVPSECFKSKRERELFLIDVQKYVPENTDIAAVFN